jgi:hypothetical protein
MSRPFTDAERGMLQRLASRAPDADLLLAQVDLAEHDGWWFEGSQSFDISTSIDAPLYLAGRMIGGGRQIGPGCSVLVDGSVPVSDTNFIGEALLWLQDGRLSAMEYWWVTDEMPDSLPRLDQLID